MGVIIGLFREVAGGSTKQVYKGSEYRGKALAGGATLQEYSGSEYRGDVLAALGYVGLFTFVVGAIYSLSRFISQPAKAQWQKHVAPCGKTCGTSYATNGKNISKRGR